MARTMDMQELPLWFIEGTAEFSYGDDARLYGDITNTAGGSTAAKVETLVNTYLTNDGSVEQYSAGYAAVRYMHKAIVDAVEVAELTRTQILQQAGISILSQANSSPRQVLQLLQT